MAQPLLQAWLSVRPALVSMLHYMDQNKQNSYVIIFDDLKRLARDTQNHLRLRQALALRGAKVECLNFKFEDTPEGEFIETILAAQGQLERKQNKIQVFQKMTARLEQGYYVFAPPAGLVFERYCTASSRLSVKFDFFNQPIAVTLSV